jgi:hypothetical protein
MRAVEAMIVFVLAAAISTSSYAADVVKQADPHVADKVSSAVKEVQGEVVWKSKTKFSIVYRSDETSEQEILFFLDQPVRVVHRNSLDDIAIGDTVRVGYEEYVQETPQGQVIKTRPVEIVFIRSGTRPPVSAQEPEPEIESDVLISQ